MEFLGFVQPSKTDWESDINELKKDIEDIQATDLGIVATVKVKMLQTHVHEFKEAVRQLIAEHQDDWGEVTIVS